MGFVPVEKPWMSRSVRKPQTVTKYGYRKPQTKQTSDPRAMTGTRPMVSVSLPLNGLDTPAVNVNKAIIQPTYSLPPKLAK